MVTKEIILRFEGGLRGEPTAPVRLPRDVYDYIHEIQLPRETHAQVLRRLCEFHREYTKLVIGIPEGEETS